MVLSVLQDGQFSAALQAVQGMQDPGRWQSLGVPDVLPSESPTHLPVLRDHQASHMLL